MCLSNCLSTLCRYGEAYNAAAAADAPAEAEKKKRPLTGFLMYCAEARPSLPEGLTAPEQAKLLGAQWQGRDLRSRTLTHTHTT